MVFIMKIPLNKTKMTFLQLIGNLKMFPLACCRYLYLFILFALGLPVSTLRGQSHHDGCTRPCAALHSPQSQEAKKASEPTATDGAAYWTLPEVLRAVQANSLRVYTSREGVTQALAAHKALGAYAWPHVGLEAQQSYGQSSSTSTNCSTSNHTELGIQGSWTFFDPKARSAYRVAGATGQQVAQVHAFTVQNLLYEASLSYCQYVHALRLAQWHQAHVHYQEACLHRARSELDSGLGSSLSLSQAEGDLAKAHEAHSQAQLHCQRKASELKTLLALPPEAPLQPDHHTLDYATVAPELTRVWVLPLQVALGQRADLKAQTHQLQAAQHKVSQAQSAHWPTLRAFGRGGLVGSSWAKGDSRSVWRVGLEAQLPLFEGFGPTYDTQAQHAAQRSQAYALEHLRQRISQEYWVARQALEAAQARLQWVHRQVLLAQDHYTATQAQAQCGTASTHDVQTRQLALQQAVLNENEAVAQYYQARLAMGLAQGDVWSALPGSLSAAPGPEANPQAHPNDKAPAAQATQVSQVAQGSQPGYTATAMASTL
jgi:outer membrane protein TolC